MLSCSLWFMDKIDTDTPSLKPSPDFRDIVHTFALHHSHFLTQRRQIIPEDHRPENILDYPILSSMPPPIAHSPVALSSTCI